jgi:FolB domain-containing protein
MGFGDCQVIGLGLQPQRKENSMYMSPQLNGRPLDEIRLQDLHVRCTIGLYPDEAVRTQALRLQLSLFLDTRAAAASGHLDQTVDYAALAREINFILTQARFRLLESAAEALTSYILHRSGADQHRARIEAVALEIVKPEALRGTAIPSIKIFRDASILRPEVYDASAHLIFAAPEAALVRFRVPPESSLRPSFPGWHLKALLTGSAGLNCEGRELGAAEILENEGIEDAFYVNPSAEERTLLAIAHRDPRYHSRRAQSSAFGLIQPNVL